MLCILKKLRIIFWILDSNIEREFSFDSSCSSTKRLSLIYILQIVNNFVC